MLIVFESLIDIDECKVGTHKCTQNCFNRLASYYCTCNDGFYLDITDNYTCLGMLHCYNEKKNMCIVVSSHTRSLVYSTHAVAA